MDNDHSVAISYLDNNATSTTDNLETHDVYCNYMAIANGSVLCPAAALCAAERIGFGAVIPGICCVGILLNIINLIILSASRFPESSYTYLTALAVADLTSLAFFAVNGIGRGYYPNDKGWRKFEVFAYFPLGSMATSTSILLTVTVTIERFAFIYYPVESKSWCHQRVARKVVAVVVLVSCLINIPRFFAMTFGDQGQLEFTCFGKSAAHVYFAWVYFSLVSLAPCLCLIVFNTLLIIGINRTNRRRKLLVGSAQNKNRNQEEATLTRTLIMVVCVFVAGELPSSFTSRGLIVALIGQGDAALLQATGYRIATLVSTGLVVTQHSLNFVVYCVFNRRFYAVLRHQFLRCCCCRSRLNENENGGEQKQVDTGNGDLQQEDIAERNV